MIAFIILLIGAIITAINSGFETPWFWLLAGLAAWSVEPVVRRHWSVP
jgi:hypothetical protein